MIKHFFQTVKIVFKNPIIVSTYVCILLFSQIFLVISLSKNYSSSFAFGFAVCSVLLSIIALFSGWLNMCKSLIVNENQPESVYQEQSKNLIETFFSGVSDYFTINTLIFFVASLLFFLGIYLGYNILADCFPALVVNSDDFLKFYDAIKEKPNLDLTTLDSKMWNIIHIMAVIQFFYWVFSFFVSMFVAGNYFAPKGKLITNTIKIISLNIVDILKLMGLFFICYFILSIVISILTSNIFTSILAIFLIGYFISTYNIMILRFYDNKNKSLCNSGSNCKR